MIYFGYNADTGIAQFHERDEANAVGWETGKLQYREAVRLANLLDRVYNQGVERGQAQLAANVRRMLPPGESNVHD